jgi:hypothetical protein
MDSAHARRLARGTWPIRRVDLAEEGAPDARDRSTVDERLALVWQLTQEAWALGGEPIPSYPRREAPGVVLRRA